MKAFTRTQYGGPEILQLAEADTPAVQNGTILVKIMANSVNPADWHIIRGKPFFARFVFGLLRPKDKIPGTDFAGIVVQAGNGVTAFKVGDKVFGESIKGGVFAEYACVPEQVCARMPDGASFTGMACVPVAGLTALQALVTHGQLKSGESVLINGSSGGVGHFAVQVAKARGARVTAVCSARSMDFVKSLGADEVIAYDRENIHQHNGRYDLVVDTHGNLSFRDFKRMGQRGVLTGFTTMGHMVAVQLGKAFSRYPLVQFTAAANRKDLDTLASLVHSGKLNVHIETTYPYPQLPAAISYIEAMHTKGKVAVSWEAVEALHDVAQP